MSKIYQHSATLDFSFERRTIYLKNLEIKLIDWKTLKDIKKIINSRYVNKNNVKYLQ